MKQIYDNNYDRDILTELKKMKFRKWAYKDQPYEYHDQKLLSGKKYEQKKQVSPCFEDLQEL